MPLINYVYYASTYIHTKWLAEARRGGSTFQKTFSVSRTSVRKANYSDTEASFLDSHLSISDVKIKNYDKRDDFGFDIVNFPFLNGDVPRSTSYGVYISKLIRLLECPVMLTTLILIIKF